MDGLQSLPLADVLLAVGKKAQEATDAFLSDSKAWDIQLDDCIGALVWMTPTFNSYFNDLRETLVWEPSHGLHLGEPGKGYARDHGEPAADL